jgi:hypothetical protein
MREPIFVALLALVLLQIKHLLCDFVFQTARHVQFKGIYGHPKGIEHSAIHAVATVPCLLVVGGVLKITLILAAAEFVIHYHTDWLKERIGKQAGWTPSDHPFWIALGVDQLVHHLTYVGIVTVLLMP